MLMAKVTDKSALCCLCHQGHNSSGGLCSGGAMQSPGHAEVRACLGASCVCEQPAARARVTLPEPAPLLLIAQPVHTISTLWMQPLASQLQFHCSPHSSGVLLTSNPPGGQPHLRKSLW